MEKDMEFSELVPSVTMCRELNELGIRAPGYSLLWWGVTPKETLWLVSSEYCVDDVHDDEYDALLLLRDFAVDYDKENLDHLVSPEDAEFFPAPTLTELMGLLDHDCYLRPNASGGSFLVSNEGRSQVWSGSTAANAVAKFLIETKKSSGKSHEKK